MRVKGNLVFSNIFEAKDEESANLIINGGNLIVEGNMHLHGASRLIMRNPDDYILVNGEFLTNSNINHKDNDAYAGADYNPCLTNGLLEVKGDFSQIHVENYQGYWTCENCGELQCGPGDSRNFATCQNFKIKMSGKGVQNITFRATKVTDTEIDESLFYTLIVTKPIESGYNLNLNEFKPWLPSERCWVNLIEEFADGNPSADDTDTIPDIIRSRDGAGVATVNAKIYVFGGNNSNDIDEYDPIKGSWTSIDYSKPENAGKLKLQTPRKDTVAVAVNNNSIYIIGGENTSGYVSSVEKFSSVTGYSTKLPDAKNIPYPVSGAAAVAVGNKIYVIGGYNSGSGCSSRMQVFNTDDETWETTNPLPNMPTARAYAAAVEYNGKIYVIGGCNGADLSNYLSDMDVFDIATGVWESADPTKKQPSMNSKRAKFAANALNEEIFVLGGFDGVNYLSSIEVYHINIADNGNTTDGYWKNKEDFRHIVPIIQATKEEDGKLVTYDEPRASFGTAVVYSQIYLMAE
jgi:hypothetical protein